MCQLYLSYFYQALPISLFQTATVVFQTRKYYASLNVDIPSIMISFFRCDHKKSIGGIACIKSLIKGNHKKIQKKYILFIIFSKGHVLLKSNFALMIFQSVYAQSLFFCPGYFKGIATSPDYFVRPYVRYETESLSHPWSTCFLRL